LLGPHLLRYSAMGLNGELERLGTLIPQVKQSRLESPLYIDNEMKTRSGFEYLRLALLTNTSTYSFRKRERRRRGRLRKKALRNLGRLNPTSFGIETPAEPGQRPSDAWFRCLPVHQKRLMIKEKRVLSVRARRVIAQESLGKRFVRASMHGSGSEPVVPEQVPVGGAEWTPWGFSTIEVTSRFAAATAAGSTTHPDEWTYELVYPTPSPYLDAVFRLSKRFYKCKTPCYCQVCLPDSRALFSWFGSGGDNCIPCWNILARAKNQGPSYHDGRLHLLECSGMIAKRYRRRMGQIGLVEWVPPICQVLDFEEFCRLL
jgi:hypothetical protein